MLICVQTFGCWSSPCSCARCCIHSSCWASARRCSMTRPREAWSTDAQGNPIGSRLIAQPFTADEYFQPRPSAASYNAAASGASNWAASNYLLRDRVARQLGPIVKYRSGPKKGQPVGPDIESWFQKDQFGGKPGIVAQWAALHSGRRQNWVKADKLNAAYVADWQKTHPAEVAEWIKANPDTPEPKPEDLAVPFFASYSKTHPGTFPSRRRAQDAGWEDGEEHRAGQGRHGHPGGLLRHVAAGASRRGPGAVSRPTW